MESHKTRGEKRKNIDNAENDTKTQKRQRRDDEPLIQQFEIKPSRKLTYADYTVGWICALNLEMTAAIAMLDEAHESLPTRDDNVYALGSIAGHNVVIACLRDGIYGTTSATAVALDMKSTFPKSVDLPLMVGIGGGVPSPKYDIRLGDVVVGVPSPEGPAVRQYDYGKTISSSDLPEIRGRLDNPKPLLLSAVSRLRAQHRLRQTNRQVEYITGALAKFDVTDFACPDVDLDKLIEAECEHSEPQSCTSCSSNYVIRTSRKDRNPHIHYGTIGSGNQVIKHASQRDRIALPLGIICFETEAAGVMDYLRPLVIRGICDYCDSQKRKEFRGYAALSAAAYAKELLSMIPVREGASVQPGDLERITPANLEHRKMVMDALDFDEAGSRRATLKRAHAQTCKWILEQSLFEQWHNTIDNRCNGLLWIKGKPGTGKSTLMKFILEREEKIISQDRVIISFFFHARGYHLERSIVGMYRSLLHQLLKQSVHMQTLLEDYSPQFVFEEDNISILEDLLRRIIEGLGNKRLLCFVDALDECPEVQIRHMVSLFEELVDAIVPGKVSLHILFASRHYPNISIADDLGRILILEEQDGHSGDLVRYVNTELKIGRSRQAEQIKKDVCERSRGIFLWVVLTLRILQIEYDKGRVHNLRKRLDELPLELNDLLRDIITRDNERLPEFILCIQWILYAKRPLTREELYLALLAGDTSVDLCVWDDEEMTPAIMSNFILDCSKGLLELTRMAEATVQFIHESIREFLLLPHALADLWPGFQGIEERMSHSQLSTCCARYFDLYCLSDSCTLKDWPFIRYVLEYMMHHANLAEQSRLLQAYCRPSIVLNRWLHCYGVLRDWKYQHSTLPRRPLCALATLGFYNLIPTWLPVSQISETDLKNLIVTVSLCKEVSLCKKIVTWNHERKSRSMEVSLDYVDILSRLIPEADSLTRPCKPIHIAGLLLSWPSVHGMSSRRLLLELIAFLRCSSALSVVLSNNAFLVGDVTGSIENCFLTSTQRCRLNEREDDCTDVSEDGSSKVSTRSNLGIRTDFWTCIEIWSSKVNKPCFRDMLASQLFDSAQWIGSPIMAFLIKHGADVNRRDKWGLLPLQFSGRSGHREEETAIRLLLEHGADPNQCDFNGITSLHTARTETVVEILLHHGADINARTATGHTPLHYQILSNTETIIEYLLRHGADPEIPNAEGHTPLDSAMLKILSEKWSTKSLRADLPRRFQTVQAERMQGIQMLLDAGAQPPTVSRCKRSHDKWAEVAGFLDRLQEHTRQTSDGTHPDTKGGAFDWWNQKVLEKDSDSEIKMTRMLCG